MAIPAKFLSDIQTKDTVLFPKVIIHTHGFGLNWNLYYSTNKLIFDGGTSGPENSSVGKVHWVPILLTMPSIKEKYDIDTKKYIVSKITLKFSNALYEGNRMSDVLSQAAAGDIDMLQAFAEILEIAGLDKSALADELHRLADMAEKDPNIVDPGSGQYPPRQSYDSGGQTKPGTAGMSRTEEEDAWLYDRSPEEQLGLRDDDDDPGIVLPSPGKGMTHDPMGRPGSRGGTSPLRGKAMRK